VRLPSAIEPTAKATSSRQDKPTWRSRACLASGVGDELGKWAKASKVSPTTRVMKGAIPPEAMEDKMAGSTRMKKWRRGTRENNKRMEGVSGLAGGGGGG
jgi:hypothetical protein